MIGVRKSGFLRTIPLLITIFSLTFPVYARYGGGTGEPNDPYQIATAEDLMLLGESGEDYDKHFILTADIDMDPNLPYRKIFDKALIGYFKGIFGGNGHSILHLTIKGSGFLGLFRRLAPGSEVRDVKVVDVNVVGTSFGVGGLVGYNDGDLVNCYTSGIVSSTGGAVGGLVGQNFGHVMECYSTVTVSGKHYVGGLVGENLGRVIASYSASEVSGDWLIGGLVGTNGTDSAIRGGAGTISNCYSMGQVTAVDGVVGGFVGMNTAGTVTRCYSTGAVVGNHDIGGLVGANQDTVIQCFWDIQTSNQTTSDGGIGKTSTEMQIAGTFLIWCTCDNEGTWWIDEGNDYPRLWWENRFGEPITVGASLSELLTGDGVEDNPYLIYTGGELNLVGLFPCDWDKYFKLMADIDLSDFDGKENRPALNIIGSDSKSRSGVPFTGVFDGNGHTIANFTYAPEEEVENIGLFGYIADVNALIKNMGLVDPNVDAGTQWNVGCLAGCLKDGSITGCYVEGGSIKGGDNVGCLVGYNDSGIITSCRITDTDNEADDHVGGIVGFNRYGSIITSLSSGSITSRFGRVGGLVGVNNRGNIKSSYSTGPVIGDSDVGGLVGDNDWGSIKSSYSTGPVIGNEYVGGLVGYNYDGIITMSFWDMETSSQPISAGGTGKTTVEMQTASTFLDASWDFVDETVNGTENIWWIDEGQDYPRLRWERDDLFFLVVDDFESYNHLDPDDPESNRIWMTWIDGFNDPENGSIVDYEFSPSPLTIVHRGQESMPYLYDNSDTANYSEATMTLVYPRDWTIEGIRILSLWFHGNPTNTPEPMYVALANDNGTMAVVYHNNPNATQVDIWTEWRIDLQEFIEQGVDLTNINSITIGFGYRNNRVAGGSGWMFFDDIGLYRPTSITVVTETGKSNA